MNLLIAFIVFSATPEPVTRFSDKIEYVTGTVYRCFSMGEPIYYHEDETGKLKPVQYDQKEEAKYVGRNLYDVQRGLPISAGLRRDATHEKFVSIHSDLDWKYPDRRIEWTLIDSKFSGSTKIPVLSQVSRETQFVRKAADDYVIYNNAFRVRMAQRIPVKSSTDFTITYRLTLVDMKIKGKPDANGYITPDENGEFEITTPDGEYRFSIGKPKILSATYAVICDETKHTVRYVKEGVYEYIKLPSAKLTLSAWQSGDWIDADTYTSGTGGRVSYSYAYWPTLRTAASGDSAATGNEYENIGYTYANTTLYRNFFDVDTSGIVDSHIISAAVWNYRMYFDVTVNVSCQQGTHDFASFGVSSYNDFSGSVWGTNSSSTAGWKTLTFNATGIAAVNKKGSTKICMREYDHDVVGTDPGANNYYNRLYNTYGSNKPYLSITAAPPASQQPVPTFYFLEQLARSRR